MLVCSGKENRIYCACILLFYMKFLSYNNINGLSDRYSEKIAKKEEEESVSIETSQKHLSACLSH